MLAADELGRAQGLENVLAAASVLAADVPRVQIIFVGGGVEADALAQRATTMGLENVVFLARMPMAEVGKVLSLADVLLVHLRLVHLRDDPLFEITIPGKTQAYMSVGKRLLTAVRGDAADLARTSEAGVACEPGTPRALAAVTQMSRMSTEDLQEMDERGKEFYRAWLLLAVGARAFLGVLEEVAQ